MAEAQIAADASAEDPEDDHPSDTSSLSSYLDVSEDVELDLSLYAVDELELSGVDSYVRADARGAWRSRVGLELALGVQNLCDDAHQEFGSGFLSNASEIERAVYASVRWRP